MDTRTILEKDRISYMPYRDNLKWNAFFVFGGAIISVTTLVVKYHPDKWTYNAQTVLVVGILIACIGLFRFFVLDGITLIFDARSRYIYKKYPLLSPFAALSFDTAHSIIIEQEYGQIYYCITRKGNLFGRNLRISTDFKENKRRADRIRFEDELLPAIADMLEI
ncbi:MAG: hypothetical protein LBV74_19275 [Tannerella sp.]|jgi:hypothetical protein|nr:hypothetical protein [Tannerella sp.]